MNNEQFRKELLDFSLSIVNNHEGLSDAFKKVLSNNLRALYDSSPWVDKDRDPIGFPHWAVMQWPFNGAEVKFEFRSGVE